MVLRCNMLNEKKDPFIKTATIYHYSIKVTIRSFLNNEELQAHMKEILLKYSLFTQSITLLLTLITNGLTNTIFFALFWVSTIISLITILSLHTWLHEEVFSFGAITFSMVGGVLYSIRALVLDTYIVSLIVILLLLAAAGQARKVCVFHKKATIKKVEDMPRVTIIDTKPKTSKQQKEKSKTDVKKANAKKTVAKKIATKKKVTKKKAVTKKKNSNTKKVSAKSKKAKAISHGKYHKPKLPTTKKKVAKKKTSEKTSSSKKK